jgi:TrpR-related protein YerC/YecD
MASWKDKLTDQLVSALLTLKDQDEVYRFLEDVATISEIKAWAQRLEVARLLRQNHTYPQITKITGASTATISRVRKFLDYGADGYRIALDRLAKDNAEKEKSKK